MIKYYYISGDLHGDWRPVRNWVDNELKTNPAESALILLGDVGANYFLNKRDKEFKIALNKLGITCYCMRGNHEMRVFDAKIFGNYVLGYDSGIGGLVYTELAYPNIHYLLDEGGVYYFGGNRTLVIPGAYSVDKPYRLCMGWNWFANEQLNDKEMAKLFEEAKIIKHFDYVFAHTCPYSWEKYIDYLFLNGIDQSKIDKTTEKFLDKVIKEITYNHFYFGHFHDDINIKPVNATMLFKKFIPLGCELTEQVDE